MPTSLSALEISKRLNGRVHESFIKFLCDQGKIDFTPIPSRDARKKYIYMIPEEEIDKIESLLFNVQNKAEHDLTKKEEKWLNAHEVAKCLDISVSTVQRLYATNVFETKEERTRNNRPRHMYSESSVLKYMETLEKEKENKKMAGIKPAVTKKVDCIANDKTLKLQEQIQGYKNLNNNLQVKCDKLENECKSYKVRIKNLEEKCDEFWKESCDKDTIIKKYKNDFEQLQKQYDLVHNKLQKMIDIENEEGKSFSDGYEKCKQDLAVMLIQKKGRLI